MNVLPLNTAQAIVDTATGRATAFFVRLIDDMRLRLSGNLAFANETAQGFTSDYTDIVEASVDVEQVTENTAILVLIPSNPQFTTSKTVAGEFRIQYRLVDADDAVIADAILYTYNNGDNPPSTPFNWHFRETLVFAIESQNVKQGKNTIKLQAREGAGFAAGDSGALRETTIIALVKR